MANGSKVFVSPGVYTSEKDLSFVAQSVGVTTLGLVGEALKGPAFEPIFISSYDDYVTRFGGTSPQTYVDSQIPKYEMGYISKSYLSQANQLFVTRVLGLSGYDAGPSWSIQTAGAIDKSTVASSTTSSHDFNWAIPFDMNTGSVTGITIYSSATVVYNSVNGVAYTGAMTTQQTGVNGIWYPTILNDSINFLDNTLSSPSTGGLGTVKPTLDNKVLGFIWSQLNLTVAGVTTGLPVTAQHSASTVTATVNGDILQYGCVDTAAAVALAVGTGQTVSNMLGHVCDPLTSYKNDWWYDSLFNYDFASTCCSGGTYSGVSVAIYNKTNPTTGGTGGEYILSGTVRYDVTQYSATPDADTDGMVVATLRSRGLSTTTTGGPVYTVTGTSDVILDCTGSYVDVLRDPFASFGISATSSNGQSYTFKTSMNTSSKDYLSKVFGRAPFDKVDSEVPVFLEESYPALLRHLYNSGKVRGLQCCLNDLPGARGGNPTTIGWYMNEWRTPETPWIVSELQGTDVFRLFKCISISDGTSANREYKVSISNLSFERGEFDILVRDFYDTDASPQILEKFTRCSMDPTKVSFLGRKVGTSTGEFELKSKYIMLQLGDGVLDGTFIGSIPCGFEGYRFRKYGTCSQNPYVPYKTKYYNPGETVYDPPFGSGGVAGGISTVNNKVLSGGDKVSKNYLGVASSLMDNDFFDYKGLQVPTAVCTGTVGDLWPVVTQGFHMDFSASTIVGGYGTYVSWSGTTLNGKSIFNVGATTFSSEPTSTTDPYKKLRSRKFTLVPHGGFDGWDIYRKTRSNTDEYRMGLTGFLAGACSTTEFPTASGSGTFKKLSQTESNTDYFAYLRGIKTFSNPEAIDINVFATPGINYVDNLGLVNESIDMVESDRADSLYVTTTPDYNMFVKTTTDINNMVGAEEAVDGIEDSLIDSNYTATYYPWIQIQDSANNKQLFIPPTAEVMRNIALTDNTSFPWFASAGYTRGLVNATKARKKLTLDERDTLYVGRINPIATFSDVGPIIWGNKTLQVKESALDRINVRRLLLQTRKLISAVSVRLIFEQNDDIVRQQFLDLVNPILDSIRRDRGLTDFRVVLSSDPEEIDRNEMSGKIYIKPTRALEYIFVEFLVTPTGASFEDV